MCNKIFGFYGCDFLKLPEPEVTGWEKSTKTDYFELIKESNFAILHNGKLEESDFTKAKRDAIFIRVSQGGQENLREKPGVNRPEKNVYCLNVWNQQPLKNNPDAIIKELLNLSPKEAEKIWKKNFDGLSENLKLLFSKPGNSDILCYWWMLCKVYFLYNKAKNEDNRTNGLLKDKKAWKLILPDDKAKDQVDKAKDQVEKAKDQVEKDIDYMCKSRGITISEDDKNKLVYECKCFIDIVTEEDEDFDITDNALTELQKQLEKLFPTQGGQK